MEYSQEEEKQTEHASGANYDNFAYYYDLQYSQLHAHPDFDFYRDLARKAGANARLLELGCGSGRLTIPLAQAGFRITGLDLSANAGNCPQKISPRTAGSSKTAKAGARRYAGFGRDTW